MIEKSQKYCKESKILIFAIECFYFTQKYCNAKNKSVQGEQKPAAHLPASQASSGPQVEGGGSTGYGEALQRLFGS